MEVELLEYWFEGSLRVAGFLLLLGALKEGFWGVGGFFL
jgi:hypothetical protein